MSSQGDNVAGSSILGTRVQRKEDPKFLTSGGVYADDLRDERLAGAAHVATSDRSPRTATIESIDTADALAMPGCIAVHTAESSASSRSRPTSTRRPRGRCSRATRSASSANRSPSSSPRRWSRRPTPPRPSIVDYDYLTAHVDIEAALASETLIYDAAGSNAVFDTTALGMPENSDTDEFFADCDVVVSGAS